MLVMALQGWVNIFPIVLTLFRSRARYQPKIYEVALNASVLLKILTKRRTLLYTIFNSYGARSGNECIARPSAEVKSQIDFERVRPTEFATVRSSIHTFQESISHLTFTVVGARKPHFSGTLRRNCFLARGNTDVSYVDYVDCVDGQGTIRSVIDIFETLLSRLENVASRVCALILFVLVVYRRTA